MGKVLTKIHLLKALKERKVMGLDGKKRSLPHSYKSLLALEKSGIIPSSRNTIEYGARSDRTYTEQEIKDIVDKVYEYKIKKGNLPVE